MTNSDNPRTGSDFEVSIQAFFALRGVILSRDFPQPVGMRAEKRQHSFDLGSVNPPLLIECKCHTWTVGGNSPSAKLAVWNEAMFYFAAAPAQFQKILLVKRSLKGSLALADHYVTRFGHLIPSRVTIVEYDNLAGAARIVFPEKGTLQGAAFRGIRRWLN
ncbi:MAG: hypothetical protein WAM82_24470 [Thermoanaerobaculia bacterium]